MKELEEIKNIEVRKEAFKLLEIFEEGFLNSELDLVICHPVNPVDICDDFNYRLRQRIEEIGGELNYDTERTKNQNQ